MSLSYKTFQSKNLNLTPNKLNKLIKVINSLMKRGTSPIKTKILSDFMQKLSGKKQDNPPSDQKLNLTQTSQFKDKLKQTRPKQIIRSIETTSNVKTKPGLQKSIDDMFGFGQSIPKSRYASTKQKQQTITKNQQLQKSKQSIRNQPQRTSQVTDSVLEQSARSGQSSTSMIVNNSSMKYILNHQDKFISPPVKALNFEQRKSQTPQIKINIFQKRSIQNSEFLNESQLKSKFDQIQSLTKQKSFFIDKVNKLEQQLTRKEKQLSRKVNEINSTTLEREVILNFISNLTQKLNQFLSKKEFSSQKQISSKTKIISHSLNKSVSSRSQIKSNNSLSASKLKSPKPQLESISQDKEISLVQSIDVRLLDELTKSMQKGLSRSEMSKKSEELVSVFRRLLMQLKKSEETLVSNVRGEYSKVEKQFQTQKQAINRIQKLYETEKGKNDKLIEREKSLNQQLQQIQEQHNKCLSTQSQLSKQLQRTKQDWNKSKQQLVQKQSRLSDVQEKLKQFRKIPHQHSLQKQEIKRNYDQILKDKQAQMATIRKNTQKQLKLKISQNQMAKQQLYQAQKKVQSLQKTIIQQSTKISDLNFLIAQKQSAIKIQNSQQASLNNQLKIYENQQNNFQTRLNNKQMQFQQLNSTLIKQSKKIFQLEFTSQQSHSQLTTLRAHCKQLQLNQLRLLQTQKQLKDALKKAQQQNSLNLQQAKRWKASSDKTQQQLLTQIKANKSNELSSKKAINKLQVQLQQLSESSQHLNTKVVGLERLNMEQQKKLIQYETSANLHIGGHSQPYSIYKELAQIQISKCDKLVEEKQAAWRAELKFAQEKYLHLKQEYWKDKQLTSSLKLQNQSKTSQNQQLTSKLNLYLMSIELITQKLTHLISHCQNLNPSSPRPIMSKEQIEEIIYQQNTQLADLLITMRPEQKKLHQLMKLLIKVQLNTHQYNKTVNSLQTTIYNLTQPLLAFNLELKACRILQKNINQWIQLTQHASINQAIQAVDECFGIALRIRNKIQENTSIKAHLSQLAKGQENPDSILTSSQLQTSIDENIVKVLSKSQASPPFPNYIQCLNQLIIKLLTKLSDFSTLNTTESTNKHQWQITQLKQTFTHQIQLMEHQLNQLKQQITIKECQSNTQISNLNISYQTQLQRFNATHNQQISSLSQTLNQHLFTINSLQHQLNYQNQQNNKLLSEIYQLKANLHTETQHKTRLSAQIHSLNIQLHNFKQYEVPKLTEKSIQLQCLLDKKNQQLKHAYQLVENHLTAS